MLHKNRFLLCTMFLLAPVGVSSQTPPTAEKNAVAIKADFVLLKTSTFDDYLFHFDLVPLSGPEQQDVGQEPLAFEYASGYPTTLLHQELQQKTAEAALTRRNIFLPVIVAANDIPVIIAVDEEVTDFNDLDVTSTMPSFLPVIQRRLRVVNSFTLTPHLNANHSISLDCLLPPGFTTLGEPATHQVRLPPIASGSTLVIRGLYTPPPARVFLPNAVLLKHYWTLLIFITPTILSTGGSAGNITGKP